ncbi:MAG: hypothetical protein KU28_00460 [Sulfurovum sp. PC08-66]|nr:MAG: hypothetical protein KU28_00460 [Sulfurovum sp. PC08-66]KIM12441.1 MAG: hypothetical protein KU37_00580 [Sulfuricurvum sp. PC08-66]
MKKIAFYIPLLNIGGAERVVIDILNQLSNIELIDKYYLIVDEKESSIIDQISKKVEILHLEHKKFGLIYKAYSLNKLLKLHKIDLVVSHLTHANLHVLITKSIFNFKSKVLITEHSILSQYIDSVKSAKHYVMKKLLTKLYNKSDHVIAVSNAVKNDLVNNWSIKNNLITRIYNPIDINKIEEQSNKSIESDLIFKLKNKKVIVSIGRLEKQKNHKLLLESINILKERNKNFILLVIGGGSEKENLEKFIDNNHLNEYVFLLGHQTNPYKYLKFADIFILPSLIEGFGIVLVEALYFKKRIIATNIEAAKEVLENGKYGYLCEATPLDMSEAIQNTFDAKTDVYFPKNKANDFNIEKIANEYTMLISVMFDDSK